MKNLIKKILFEETKKDYSPAGKEIIPNKIVIHKSNPMFRDKINEIGLKARAGECYKIYVGYGEKCKPAIFATNSTNKRSWFDSTYDDDVWEINTEMIPNVKWYKDRHFESTKKHIVTFQDIPKEAIKLLYEGTGRDGGINESTDKSEDKKLKLVKDIIYNMYDNVRFVEYIDKRNEIMVYYTNHDNRQMLIPTEICELISNYTGLDVVPWYEYNKNRVGILEPDFYLDTEEYEEELNENYSPAGKEITPNKIVIHKSNPKFRDKISNEGLKAIAGECYKIYAGYGEKCIPAIFATNSINKRAWFDSTYDDDVWSINTELIPNVKWYKDRHFESTKKHIVTFENIPPEAIELMSEGTGRDLMKESTDKSEDKKLKLVTKMINDFFDEVSFIEIKKYENKQLIRVYFDNDENAANEEMHFAEQIQDKIYEYTGIKLIPYWRSIQYYGDADFRLDAIKLKYDNLGNVINESTENKDIEKNLKVIRTILSQVSWEGLCDIWVEYNPKDKDYEIRSKSTKRHIEHEEIIKELDYIEQTIIDLKLRTYIFTPQYVDNCEDEVKFMNENLNKSNKKILNYIYHAKIILEPFIDMPEICDIEITYDELDGYYDINVVFSMEKLKEKHLVDLISRMSFVQKIKNEIKEEIELFLPKKNVFIGSTAETKCKSK